MSVVEQNPFNEHVGNGVTSVFGYTFQLLDADDLKVYLDGVLQPTSIYSVSGIGNQAGGDVTFTPGNIPASGVVVLLSREIQLARDTDYQYAGELREATLDEDFNRLWQALQGQRAILNGAVRAPYPETMTPLPAEAARANQFLVFDASGNPQVSAGTGADAGLRADLADTTNPANGAALVGFKQSGTGAVPRSVRSKLLDFVSVKDFGAVGNNSANETVAFQRARDAYLAGDVSKIKVPAGIYRVDPAFDFGSSNWEFDLKAELRNLSGGAWTGSAGGIGVGDLLSPAVPPRVPRLVSDRFHFQQVESNLTTGSFRDDMVLYSRWYDGNATDSYWVGATNVYSFMQYGEKKRNAGQFANGTVSALSAHINVFAANNGSSGRTEITPIATGVNCSSTTTQIGVNIYNDFVTAGPVGNNAANREGFLAAGSFYVAKFTPGNNIDADHDGSYGVSIVTRPGNPGFSFENRTERNYPVKSGVAVVGWSGLPSTANGEDPGADFGFEIGVQVGGVGGSVWMPASAKTTRTSKIATGILVSDYVLFGINITGRHPSAGTFAPALSVSNSAGPVVLGDTLPTAAVRLFINGMPGQFESGLRLGSSTHSTSRRAGIDMEDWVFGQDGAGNGTKDFFFFHKPTGFSPIVIGSNGRVRMQLPTSTAGLASGSLWNDSGTVKIVP